MRLSTQLIHHQKQAANQPSLSSIDPRASKTPGPSTLDAEAHPMATFDAEAPPFAMPPTPAVAVAVQPQPHNKIELQQWIKEYQNGTNRHRGVPNSWDISNITDLSFLLAGNSSFNEDISQWNTEHVVDMSGMFLEASSFNQPIGQWITANVKDTHQMFLRASSFNQDISQWNTQQVVDMHQMFSRATSFNTPLQKWDTSNVVDMSGMFDTATSFNQPIGRWNVSRVQNLKRMFQQAISFNQCLDDNRWIVERRWTFVKSQYSAVVVQEFANGGSSESEGEENDRCASGASSESSEMSASTVSTESGSESNDNCVNCVHCEKCGSVNYPRLLRLRLPSSKFALRINIFYIDHSFLTFFCTFFWFPFFVSNKNKQHTLTLLWHSVAGKNCRVRFWRQDCGRSVGCGKCDKHELSVQSSLLF